MKSQETPLAGCEPAHQLIPLTALNKPPDVNCEVDTFVQPTCSTWLKPVVFIKSIRSLTEIAPPIQFDHASRVLHMAPAQSSFKTMSANCSLPSGFKTRNISLKHFSFKGDRFNTPFEITTSKVLL